MRARQYGWAKKEELSQQPNLGNILTNFKAEVLMSYIVM